MNHTHEYKYWHAHSHRHVYPAMPPGTPGGHDTGHYHLYMNTHEHGKGGADFHSHQVREKSDDDEYTLHHHAVADHE